MFCEGHISVFPMEPDRFPGNIYNILRRVFLPKIKLPSESFNVFIFNCLVKDKMVEHKTC